MCTIQLVKIRENVISIFPFFSWISILRLLLFLLHSTLSPLTVFIYSLRVSAITVFIFLHSSETSFSFFIDNFAGWLPILLFLIFTVQKLEFRSDFQVSFIFMSETSIDLTANDGVSLSKLLTVIWISRFKMTEIL